MLRSAKAGPRRCQRTWHIQSKRMQTKLLWVDAMQSAVWQFALGKVQNLVSEEYLALCKQALAEQMQHPKCGIGKVMLVIGQTDYTDKI